MQIERFGPESVDFLYSFLKGRPGILAGLTRSYIWENTRPGYFIGTYCTKSKTRKEEFSSIFYQFGSKDGYVIEEWYSSGEDHLEAIREMASMFGPRVYFNLAKMDTGNDLGWIFNSKRLEMTMATSKVCSVIDSTHDLETQYTNQVVELLAQEWWTTEQARQFVSVTSSNPSGVSRVILHGTIVAAFGHAAHDAKQAWINTIYVHEEFRGKGFGRGITEGIALELWKRGVEEVNLGVGEDNDEAIRTYREIGFNFTDFVRYRFEVVSI